jgi:hypothetical protein
LIQIAAFSEILDELYRLLYEQLSNVI